MVISRGGFSHLSMYEAAMASAGGVEIGIVRREGTNIPVDKHDKGGTTEPWKSDSTTPDPSEHHFSLPRGTRMFATKHVILVQIQSYTTVAAQPRRCSRPRNPTTHDSWRSRPTFSGSQNYIVAAQYREEILGLIEVSSSCVAFSPEAARAQG